MKLSRGAGLIFGIMMGLLLALLFAPFKGKDFIRRLKKEIAAGGYGFKTVRESFTGMGRNIVDVSQDIYENPEVQKHMEKGKKSLLKKIKELFNR
ncbi:hypothetical protein ACFL2V_03335 [Pseudomonadota bacterium]